ncbi:hypothetical protein [Mycobacterium sp.]|uniref:hypothetical protein n=1 Tax=Mycobacterium sp. TaxID=1785 RepID=UPI00257C137D|nr:hypothetical protein [Mycobacterium sp.]
MSTRIQLWCAWAGPAAVVVAGGGFLIAGVLPSPLGPNSSVTELVDFYSHSTRVAAGLVIAGLGMCLVFPLIALIGVYMVRVEGRTPILTFLQLITGAATVVLLLMPILLMTIISFRPDRNPELTVTLNDISWLLFLTPIAPFMIQNIAIGTAILHDQQGLLPRWVGYLNYWVAFLFVPDVLAFFFHSGPFAWRGIFVFWLAFVAYSVFLIVMGWALQRVVVAESQASATTAAP